MISKYDDKYSKITFNTKKILYYILISGGIIAASILVPNLPYEILKAYIKNKKFQKGKFNRDIKRLSERGDVEISKDSVIITKKGRSRILKYTLDDLRIKKQKKWDRKWRLVIFDIPDHRRNVSNVLRSKLYDLGFLQYQKSVFIYPYPCRDEIDYLKEIFEIPPYIKLIEAISIDDKEYFLRKFFLG